MDANRNKSLSSYFHENLYIPYIFLNSPLKNVSEFLKKGKNKKKKIFCVVIFGIETCVDENDWKFTISYFCSLFMSGDGWK